MEPHRYQWPLVWGWMPTGRAASSSVLAVVVVAMLAGCSNTGPAATLGERVDRYWELKQAKRWEEVYDSYLDPAAKERVSKEAFLAKRKLAYDILSYTVTEAREDGDQAVVVVTNESNIPAPAGRQKLRMLRQTVKTEDKWVRRDGAWYVDLPG